jgi:thioredoxin:protein disulfide reductase
VGAFSMGLVAGLIAAPCTGPVLLGILAFVATHQSVALGSLLLFLYALGVGAPFFVIGVFSFNLGKSGPWMDAVKSAVGVVLLIMAVFEIRLSFPGFGFGLPAAPGIVFAIAGVVALGVLLGAIHRSFHGSAAEKTLKTAGLALVILGVTARLDVESVALAQSPGGIPWVKDLDKALADAKAAHQPVFVDFYADWCAACKELDRKTYPDPKVRNEAKRFVAVKIDGTHESDALDKIYDRYKIEGLPTVIFMNSDGTLVKDQRVIGFVEPAEMVELLKKVQ